MPRYVVIDAQRLPKRSIEFLSLAYVHRDQRVNVYLRREFDPAVDDAGDPIERRRTLVVAHVTNSMLQPDIEIPLPERSATALFKDAHARLFLSRVRFRDAGLIWDVDVFHVANDGLAIASCETPPQSRPRWLGTDVTADRRFEYQALAERPWRTWPDADDPFGDVPRALDDPE